MKVINFQYKAKKWSVENFPDLDSANTLVLIFYAPDYAKYADPIHELCQFYKNSIIAGCSSAGEILEDQVDDDTIAVSVIKFNHTQLKAVSIDSNQYQSFDAGQLIYQDLESEDLKAILVLSGGMDINGTQLANGLNKNKRKDVLVSGGLAGDGGKFEKTSVVVNSEIRENHIIGIGLYGEKVRVSCGSKGGWDIFGPERKITKSKDNILYELDGRPALELYKDYLGEKANELPASGLLFPLSIRKNSHDDNYVVRTILGVNEENQSLEFAGDIPQGYLAKLMKANFDRLIDGAESAASQLTNKNRKIGNKGSDGLLLAISCVGRKLLLGERITEEVEITLSMVSKHTRQIGFYSYGELSPYTNGTCELHNQTMTLTKIYEEEV